MAVFARSKRVTDPLNDNVKACLCGKSGVQFSSSGSEHDGEEDYDSPCFSHLLIHGFLQQDDDDTPSSSNTHAHSHDDESCNAYLEDQSRGFESEVSLKKLVSRPSENSVLDTHLSIAMDKFAFLKANKPVFMRNVMCFLRDLGHNAGICKTKWESTGALTAGNYEFIDVVRSDGAKFQERYFVDVDFAGEFIIARPSKEYEDLFKNLPKVYIGRSEELKKTVRLLCDATKRSLKSKDLHLPPWRKNRYMQLKWFGPYRRTTNPVSASTVTVSCPSTSRAENFTAKCRSVGFDAVKNSNGRFAFPAATRTR